MTRRTVKVYRVYRVYRGGRRRAVGTLKPGWDTDVYDFAKAVEEFEEELPGFWWSVGQCSVGAHASCGVDARLDGVKVGEPLDVGFHCDTRGGSPADALHDVMWQAVDYLQAAGLRVGRGRHVLRRKPPVELDRSLREILAGRS